MEYASRLGLSFAHPQAWAMWWLLVKDVVRRRQLHDARAARQARAGARALKKAANAATAAANAAAAGAAGTAACSSPADGNHREGGQSQASSGLTYGLHEQEQEQAQAQAPAQAPAEPAEPEGGAAYVRVLDVGFCYGASSSLVAAVAALLTANAAAPAAQPALSPRRRQPYSVVAIAPLVSGESD
jgi:hypothetical protein